MTTSTPTTIQCAIPADCAGQRLDQALAILLPCYSRARLQKSIKQGCIRLDGQSRRPRHIVWGGERVSGEVLLEAETSASPQALELDVRYQDNELIVVNKPAGLVVHPAAGNPDGTLLNALLHYAPELTALPRGGIVHRLDKNTTGLMVVARSLPAHASLVRQLADRSVTREYQAVVTGVVIAGATVSAPIGRHPVDRKRMAVVTNGKHATTHFRVLRRFRRHTHLHVMLETGRTHQIRVHLQHLRHPIVGDPVYGGIKRGETAKSSALGSVLSRLSRQALHATRLALIHPGSGQPLSWDCAPPDDMQDLLDALAAEQTET